MTRLPVSRVEVVWERNWESFAWRQGWLEMWMVMMESERELVERWCIECGEVDGEMVVSCRGEVGQLQLGREGFYKTTCSIPCLQLTTTVQLCCTVQAPGYSVLLCILYQWSI